MWDLESAYQTISVKTTKFCSLGKYLYDRIFMYLIELKSPTIFRKFIESENQPRIFLKFNEKFCFIFSLDFHGNDLYFIFHRFS